MNSACVSAGWDGSAPTAKGKANQALNARTVRIIGLSLSFGPVARADVGSADLLGIYAYLRPHNLLRSRSVDLAQAEPVVALLDGIQRARKLNRADRAAAESPDIRHVLRRPQRLTVERGFQARLRNAVALGEANNGP